MVSTVQKVVNFRILNLCRSGEICEKRPRIQTYLKSVKVLLLKQMVSREKNIKQMATHEKVTHEPFHIIYKHFSKSRRKVHLILT